VDLGAATHPGYVRHGNEDGFFASRAHGVFAVADGMGGHEHGELASRLALAAIETRAEALGQAAPPDLPTLLHETIQTGNADILAQGGGGDGPSMGTTVVLATICVDRLYFAHIGDSRLYLLRGDVFTQLTHDHTRVQLMVDRGEITAEEAALHPLRHQITRVVGYDDDISPEIASQALEPGDTILLCTDGLSGAAPDEQVKHILRSPLGAQERADALVQAALDAGGPDNVTAVVISYQRPRPAPKPRVVAPARKPAPVWQRGVIAMLTVAVAALAVPLLAPVARPEWIEPLARYYIAADADQHVGLYRHWPLLPLRKAEAIAVPEVGTLTYEDAKRYEDKLVRRKGEDIRTGGITADGRDVGVEMIKRLAKDTAADLFDRTRMNLDQKNAAGARICIERARALRADPAIIDQLEAQIAQVEKLKPPASRN
jgi:serine/threonine protein phosphatase PrpC